MKHLSLTTNTLMAHQLDVPCDLKKAIETTT